MDAREIVARSSLFSHLPDEAQERIAEALKQVDLGAGQILFHAGDPGDGLYFVAAGQIEVFATDPDTGVDIPLRTFREGEYFGEMALIGDEPRSASARATVAARLYRLSPRAFHKLVQRVPSVSIALARELAGRLRADSRQRGIAFVDLGRFGFDAEAFKAVPRRVLEQHRAIPVRKSEGTLTVAMVRPNDLVGIDELRRASGGMAIEPLAVTEEDYRRYLQRFAAEIENVAPQRSFRPAALPIRYLSVTDPEAAQRARKAREIPGDRVVAELDRILNEALDLGASDIHFEPTLQSLEVRYRVDGRLQRREPSLPAEMIQPLIGRLKVLSGMDIADKRMPQDGRFAAVRGTRRVDIRAATMPTSAGEAIALRMLDPSMLLAGLDQVILASRVCSMVRNMVQSPYGLILASGPTGSGKTTSLYSMVNEIDREHLHIVTVEDPIEYEMDNITQTQVSEAQGITFARMVRAMLRQDPDVMLIGEVRDPQTAIAACEAALTGHLVISSVHTNDAVGAVARLRELGVEPFLIANALVGVLNQRLLRRVCERCRAPESPKAPVIERIRHALGKDIEVKRFYRGQGCEQCNYTGYRGRVACFEVLPISEEIKDYVVRGAPPSVMREAARDAGIVPLRAYAGFLLNAGLTSAVEVMRILYAPEA